MRIPWLVCLLICPAFGQVVINELMIRPLAESADANQSHQWVELYNKGSEAVDLSGWKLTAEDTIAGTRSADLPAVSLQPGTYLVVHFSPGTDQLEPVAGAVHYYTQINPQERFLSPYAGDLALTTPDATADFFAWVSIGQNYVPGAAHAAAVAASQWTQGAALNLDRIARDPREVTRFVTAGTTLGRTSESTDSESPFDFDAFGGQDAGLPTPGAANIVDLETMVRQAPAEAAAKGTRRRAGEPAKWTVLLYLNGDNSLASSITSGLLSIARSGGSTSDVQFVFLVDRLRRAFRGRLLGTRSSGDVAIIDPPPGGSALGKVNMSDGSTLRNFLDWGMENYPAERYMLVIAGHGDGWKGIGPDNSSQIDLDSGGSRADWLYMNELKAGLSGKFLDIIWFQSCAMAGLEVAYQIRSSGRYMLATEDIGFSQDQWAEYVKLLTEDPSRSTLALARRINQLDSERLLGHRDKTYGEAPNQPLPKSHYDILVGAVIDLRGVGDLATAVNRWGEQLVRAVPIHNKRGEPLDNVQVRMQVNAAAAERAYDANFVDLHDLATKIGADKDIPACAKQAIPEVLSLIEESVVVGLVKGAYHPLSRGLHIHFPLWRALVTPYNKVDGESALNEPYDFVDVRKSDGNSQLVGYYRNVNLLPLKARDREGIAPVELQAPQEAPAPPAPDFDFPRESVWWPLFLDNFYHPVAEAWIFKAVVGTTELTPVTIGGGSCENGYDYVKGPLGTVVTLSAKGSSDADMKGGHYVPYFFDWDLDVTRDCSKPPCYQPTTVPTGSDAARTATDNVDEDRSPTNTTWDDQDAAGDTATFQCKTPGTFQVRLIAWDDHHTFDFLNTRPTAQYVFPQTGNHYAVVECTDWAGTGTMLPPPGTGSGVPTPVTSGVYPYMEKGGDQVISDHALMRPSISQPRRSTDDAPGATFTNTRNYEPNYPITVSGTNITQLEANGVTVPDGGSATVLTDATGVLRTRFLTGNAASGSLRLAPAGLPAVQLPMAFATRLAPPPDDLIVIPPQSGPLTVGREYTLTLEARRAGAPLRDAIFTTFTADSNVEFRNGTLFRRNTANQTRSGANGRGTAIFRPTVNGPATLEITSGPLYRTYTYTAVGGPTGAPTSIDVLSAPANSIAGAPAEVRLRVRSGTEPLSGVRLEIRLNDGPVTAITTGANGEAVYRFTPATPVPAVITAAIPSPSLRITITVPVFPGAGG